MVLARFVASNVKKSIVVALGIDVCDQSFAFGYPKTVGFTDLIFEKRQFDFREHNVVFSSVVIVIIVFVESQS